MRWLLFALLVVHALIHGTAVVDAFDTGTAAVPTHVPPGTDLLWLAACLTLLTAAVLVLLSPRRWWIAGAIGVALSQVAIATAWADAKYGTLVNAVLLLFVIQGFAAEGPLSLRARYRRAADARRRPDHSGSRELVTEADLIALPDPVRRYLAVAGAIGRPHVRSFTVKSRGRIRASADRPWMPFTSTQTNVVGEPARFFLMKARRGGLPVDVFHAFAHGAASMRVRLLSLIPLVHARGPELTRSETVTLFNDLCVFAPGALVDAAVQWEAVDDRTARGRYTVGENTVAAELSFDAEGRLVDFVSEDRSEATGDGLVRRTWSTPIGDYREFGQGTLFSRGEARWLSDDGAGFTYIELEVTDVALNDEDR